MFVRQVRRNCIDKLASTYCDYDICIYAHVGTSFNILADESNEKYNPCGKFVQLRPMRIGENTSHTSLYNTLPKIL